MFSRSLSALIHGGAKAGKSEIAASSPPPVLLLDAEGGSRFLRRRMTLWDPTQYAPPVADGSWDVCVVIVRDFETVNRCYTWLASGQHPFKSVVLDSVSEVQQRCIDGQVGTAQMKQADWGDILRMMSDIVRKMRDLTIHPTNPLEAVILVAMTRDMGGKQKPFVQGALATTLPYYLDVIGYLYTEATEAGIQRKLLVAPHPSYEAGDRTGRLGDETGNVAFPVMTSLQASQYPFVDVLLDQIYGPRPVEATAVVQPESADQTQETASE
jgi:hypothetical protein